MQLPSIYLFLSVLYFILRISLDEIGKGGRYEQMEAVDLVSFFPPATYVLQINHTDFNREYFTKSGCFLISS